MGHSQVGMPPIQQRSIGQGSRSSVECQGLVELDKQEVDLLDELRSLIYNDPIDLRRQAKEIIHNL